MGWRTFYWRWLVRAFSRALGPADLLSGVAGAALGVVARLNPQLAPAMNELLWQVPLWALAAAMAVRLLLAPYWIWLDDQKSIAALGDKAAPREARVHLARFLELGEHLKASTMVATQNEVEASIETWAHATEAAITEHLDHSFVVRFYANAGLLPFNPPPTPEVWRENAWRFMNYRVTRLHEIIQELARAP